jgi:hypothetical protein
MKARAPASSGWLDRYSVERPAAATSTSFETRVGKRTASSAPTKPPIELPITTGSSIPISAHSLSTTRAKPGIEASSGASDSPKPGRSTAMQRCVRMKTGRLSSQFCQIPPRPWMKTSGGPSPPVSMKPTDRPSIVVRRVRAGQSTCIQELSSPSA